MDLLNILLTMGLPTVQKSLDSLLEAMKVSAPFLGSTAGTAKSLALCLALGVGSYECYMMMLGRRGMDVMKILRIFIILTCISLFDYITSGVDSITNSLEFASKNAAMEENKKVSAKEEEVAKLQSKYLDRLRAIQDSVAQAQKVQELGEDASKFEELLYTVSTLGDQINNFAKQAVVAAETKICEWINDVIRFIGMLIFQMSLYGILVAQRVFTGLLRTFGPLMFALSLAPPWKSAWSQWLSKYISLSLWGYVAYAVLYYVDYILLYNIQQDISAYTAFIGGEVNSWEQIKTLGLQGIGSNCMYVMGLLVGAYVLRYTPEAASWLIPGGVSSGIGQQAGGMVTGAAQGAGGKALRAAQGATSAVAKQAGKNLNALGNIKL